MPGWMSLRSRIGRVRDQHRRNGGSGGLRLGWASVPSPHTSHLVMLTDPLMDVPDSGIQLFLVIPVCLGAVGITLVARGLRKTL